MLIDNRNTSLVPEVVRQSPLYALLGKAYWLLIVYPMQQFFLRGWWRNQPPEDICARLTGYKSEYWDSHRDACLDLIGRDFDATLVYVELLAYVVTVACAVYATLRRCCRG